MAWFKCGGGGIPAALKSLMNAVLNKKWGTSGTYPPETWPETVNLMGPLEEKTVSGSVVTFSDGADDVPLKSCEVTIAPNLVGVSSVDVVQTGLQMLPVTIPANGNGITYTDNGDGTFKASGTATSTISNRYVFTSTAMNTLKRGETYHISGCPSGGASNTYKLQVWNSSTSSQLAVDYGNGASFTMPTEGTINVRFVIYNGQEVDFTVKPMITAVQTTEQAEYNGTTHTANLGRTIYGGEVDVVNGTGTDVYTFDLWDGTQNYNVSDNLTNVFRIYMNHAKPLPDVTAVQCICEGYTFPRAGWTSDTVSFYSDANNFTLKLPKTEVTTLEEAKAWLAQHNVTFLYATTPETFTFTPTPIISRLGDNTLWGDGDLSVTYRSSGTQTLIPPTLISKTITANGTYSAEDDNADGYDEVTVNVQGGGGNTPQATQTMICDNSSLGSTLTFTDDYENYDLIKFVVYRSDVQNTFVFYATPAMINACWQYSSNRINFNQPYGNNFVCYQKSSNTSWSRYGVRNMAVQYVYGLTFTNCTVAETELYNRQGIGSSAVTFTPPTGESFLDYDFILFMTCTGNSDETQVNLEVFQPGVEKDIFGSDNVKENAVTVYRYNTGGTVATVTENTITSYQYFYASGLKLNFNQQSLLSGSLNSSNDEELNNEEEESENESDE